MASWTSGGGLEGIMSTVTESDAWVASVGAVF
jgi:hypothetical protein